MDTFVAYRWCPKCHEWLKKTDPMSEVICKCGWIWK